MKRFKVFTIIGIAIGLGILFGIYKFQEPNAVIYKDIKDTSIAIGGDFTLTDQFGKKRSTTESRGKILLIYFGYTYCPDVCPMALENITAALKSMGRDRDKIAVIFVSVDPDRDTPEMLKLYSTNFDSNIVMLTGCKNEVQVAMEKYRVYAKKEAKDGLSDYLINHTSIVYVMDRDGSYLTSFSHTTHAEQIVKILLSVLKK